MSRGDDFQRLQNRWLTGGNDRTIMIAIGISHPAGTLIRETVCSAQMSEEQNDTLSPRYKVGISNDTARLRGLSPRRAKAHG